jgi:glycosyltransferase involved in cell wall biosynthesis
MHLVVWCHISGLGRIRLPPKLLTSNASVIFTSPCSLVLDHQKSVVSSGFVDGMSAERQVNPEDCRIRIGYIGTLDFLKLHSDFVTLMRDLPKQHWPVHVYGTGRHSEDIVNQSNSLGLKELFLFHGYSSDVENALKSLDVLVYPLSPTHYGTAENVLLEAMAMGVVPIVLNNAAERYIVDHRKTGLIAKNQTEFRDLLTELTSSPSLLSELSAKAMSSVRGEYTSDKMGHDMMKQYKTALSKNKEAYKFKEVFGSSPIDWYLSFKGSDTATPHDHDNIEARKGSLYHFYSKFPKDKELKKLIEKLKT